MCAPDLANENGTLLKNQSKSYISGYKFRNFIFENGFKNPNYLGASISNLNARCIFENTGLVYLLLMQGVDF